ncbi:MAG: helix-turn-helix domain-containing protein [Isosphaeraceae bacterium]
MAQFYTLEEAARVLGMSPEELKAKAQHREVRAFLDGGSWRFRVADVDELARRRGLGSDAELQLSELEIPTGEDKDDLDLSEFALGAARDAGAPTMEVSRPDSGSNPVASGTGSDHDILLDDLTLPPNPVTGSSSVIIGMDSSGKLPSDSDVRLVPDNPRASDSDVRLASPHDFKAPSDSDVTLIADDTSQHDLLAASGSGSGSGDTAVRPSPLLGSSAEVPAQSDSDSDFELTPSSVIDALQPDSGSDFELSALEGSDEFEATPLRKASDSDVTAADPGLAGINLSRPSDSGINLMTAAGLNFNEGESIELAPLSGDDIKTVAAPKKPATPKSDSGAKASPAKAPAAKKAEKDIFDDTDFEVDALASDGDDDKTMQLEAASDFELEESDTGSEVFAIDEEDVDQNAATAIGSVPVEDDEDDDGFAEATSGEMSASAWDVESDTPSGAAARASAGPVMARQDANAEWGGLWVGMLAVASVFMLLLAFVTMDLVMNLYDYRSDTPASGLVKTLSGFVSKT